MVTQEDIYAAKGRCFFAGDEMIPECENCEGSRSIADKKDCRGYVENCRKGFIIRSVGEKFIPLELLAQWDRNYDLIEAEASKIGEESR